MTGTDDRQQAIAMRFRTRRTVDLVLTAVTGVLFLGLLWILAAKPRAMGPGVIIGLGFALIAYSVAVTFAYLRWMDRRDRGGADT